MPASGVIQNLDQALSSFFYANLDVACTCVQGVFQQLFHYGGRPFNHLTGGDFIGQDFWKDANL